MFLIPIIVIIAVFSLYQYKNKLVFGAVSFIISVYIVMSLCAIVLYLLGENRNSFDIQLEPMLYLSLCFFIAFYGFFSYTDSQHYVLVIENKLLLKWLEIFQIFTSIGAIFFFSYFAFSALSGNIADNRIDIQYRQENLGSYALLNTFFSLIGNLFVLSIMLVFVNLATIGRGGSRFRARLLLVLSSVYIFYILAYVGRDGFVYWIFSFVFLYLIFKDFIPVVERKSVIKWIFIVAIPAFFAFMAITLSRFKNDSFLIPLLDYAGSQVFYFNDHYLVDPPMQMGLLNFKQFLDLGAVLSGNEQPFFDRYEWFKFYTDRNVVPWVFSTYIGSFFHDFGRIGTLLLVTFISIFTHISLRSRKKIGGFTFSNLIIFFVLSQIVLWGVFYYRQYTGFYYIVVMILISISFKTLRNNHEVLVLQKRGP